MKTKTLKKPADYWDINDRVEMIANIAPVSSRLKFAQAIGVSVSIMHNIRNKKYRPNIDTILAIGKTFPFISMEWLVMGRGTMTTDPMDNIQDVVEKFRDVVDTSTR